MLAVAVAVSVSARIGSIAGLLSAIIEARHLVAWSDRQRVQLSFGDNPLEQQMILFERNGKRWTSLTECGHLRGRIESQLHTATGAMLTSCANHYSTALADKKFQFQNSRFNAMLETTGDILLITFYPFSSSETQTRSSYLPLRQSHDLYSQTDRMLVRCSNLRHDGHFSRSRGMLQSSHSLVKQF